MKLLLNGKSQYSKACYKADTQGRVVNLFTAFAFCVVIFTILCNIFTSLTLAKIVDVFYTETSAGVASFAVDYNIESYDGSAFVTRAGNQGSDYERHNITYKVRNYNNDDGVNNVLTQPVFSLTVPKKLFNNVAFQFTDENNTPLTTQFLMDKILDPEVSSFSTVHSDSDYVTVDKIAVSSAMEERVTVTRSGNFIRAEGKLNNGAGDNGTVIQITDIPATLGGESNPAARYEYSVGFTRGVFMGVEGYGESYINDMSASYLYCDCADYIDQYRIDIIVPQGSLPAGVRTEKTFKFWFVPVSNVTDYDNPMFTKVYDNGTGSGDFISIYASSVAGSHYDFKIDSLRKQSSLVSSAADLADGEEYEATVRVSKAAGSTQSEFSLYSNLKLYSLTQKAGAEGVYECDDGNTYYLGNIDSYASYKYRPDTDDSDGYVVGTAAQISYKLNLEILFKQVLS